MTIKMRIEGNTNEISAAKKNLQLGFEIRSCSKFYENRDNNALGRVYLEVQPKEIKELTISS